MRFCFAWVPALPAQLGRKDYQPPDFPHYLHFRMCHSPYLCVCVCEFYFHIHKIPFRHQIFALCHLNGCRDRMCHRGVVLVLDTLLLIFPFLSPVLSSNRAGATGVSLCLILHRRKTLSSTEREKERAPAPAGLQWASVSAGTQKDGRGHAVSANIIHRMSCFPLQPSLGQCLDHRVCPCVLCCGRPASGPIVL